MTPKDKAKELVDKYHSYLFHNIQKVPPMWSDALVLAKKRSKECALMLVEEQLEILNNLDDKWHDHDNNPLVSFFIYEIEYWKEVEQEIEKL